MSDEPDTSDIPEADEAWFARAKLRESNKELEKQIANRLAEEFDVGLDPKIPH